MVENSEKAQEFPPAVQTNEDDERVENTKEAPEIPPAHEMNEVIDVEDDIKPSDSASHV